MPLATTNISAQVAGATQIICDFGQGSGLELLGYNSGNIDVELHDYYENVPSDENGGDAGAPADIQFLSEVGHIRVECTRWSLAVASKIAARVAGGVAGIRPVPGTLMLSGGPNGLGFGFRLLLLPLDPLRALNFPKVIARGSPITVGLGTKHSRFMVEFEAHGTVPGAGAVLYNNNIT